MAVRFLRAGLLAAALGGIASASAQELSDAARSTRNTVAAFNRFDTLNPGGQYAPASPADPDLGQQRLLTEQKRYQPFTVSFNYATTWTSNAFYTPNNPSSDVFMNGSLGLVALPSLGNNFFFEASANIQGFRYFRNPVLDFNSVDAGAGFVKIFHELGDVGAYARYNYSDLFSNRGAGELLHEHSIVTGVRKTFQFSRANALFLSAEASFSLGGSPGYALASEYTIFAAHQVSWTRSLQTSLFYQLQTLAFSEGGRADLINSLGLSMNFQPFKWLSIYSSTWLGWNSSNQSQNDYFTANLGGGVGAVVTF